MEMLERIIGIILCMFLLLTMLYEAPNMTGETEDPVEIIETVELPKYLTDEDLSKLYTCKKDVRKTDNNIVELSYKDARLLMQVGRSEGGTTQEGQFWTMRTIYNRLEAGWDDSLWDILTDENQFAVVTSGAYKSADVNTETHLALAQLESGYNPTMGALYWEANTNSPESWHKQNLTFIAEIQGNLFYK